MPDEFATRQQDRLTGPELAALLLDSWWYGNDPRRAEDYWVSIKGDEFKQGGAWGSADGSWYIEADQLCVDATTYGLSCNDVYRNPEGARTNSDEYVIVLPTAGIFPFSVYAERPPALKGE